MKFALQFKNIKFLQPLMEYDLTGLGPWAVSKHYSTQKYGTPCKFSCPFSQTHKRGPWNFLSLIFCSPPPPPPAEPLEEEWTTLQSAAPCAVQVSGSAASGMVGLVLGKMNFGESSDYSSFVLPFLVLLEKQFNVMRLLMGSCRYRDLQQQVRKQCTDLVSSSRC